jgi:hypothetical protein
MDDHNPSFALERTAGPPSAGLDPDFAVGDAVGRPSAAIAARPRSLCRPSHQGDQPCMT